MRIRDWTPSVRAAGKTFQTEDREGITAELREAVVPPTPKNVAPFRKSFQARVGLMARHWGFRNDPEIPADEVCGMKNEYASSAEECLRAAASFKGLNALAAENAEKKYLRNRKEPLGASAEAPYELPPKTKKENFAFGIASDKSESAKSLIYAGTDRDSERIVPTDPGRQKDRKYDWAKVKIDPTRFRFGRASSADAITTKELFQPQTVTHILPRIVQDFESVARPHLEMTQNLGFGSRKQKKDFTYGYSNRADEMGTRLLIGGSGNAPEPDDPNLGRTFCKSVTLRHLRESDSAARRAQGEDPNRVFGCPSVRLDLRRPKYRKVTNPNNYGDEPSGGSLLYPNPHNVDEELFLQKWTREKMESTLKPMLGKPGFANVTEEEFGKVLDKAYSSSADGTVDVYTINRMLDEVVVA